MVSMAAALKHCKGRREAPPPNKLFLASPDECIAVIQAILKQSSVGREIRSYQVPEKL